MAAIRWILTCDGECPKDNYGKDGFVKRIHCPHKCPYSYYEKEQPNTEVPSND